MKRREICRPVTVEIDGEETTVQVLAEEPMSDEGRAALAEVLTVAKRLHASRPPRTDICPDCGFPTGTYPHRRHCETKTKETAVTTSKPPVEVEVGQIWADKNQWEKGRTCRVVETDGWHVVLEVVTEATNKRPGLPSTVGRRSRVLYDHRGIRGYRLIDSNESGTQ